LLRFPKNTGSQKKEQQPTSLQLTADVGVGGGRENRAEGLWGLGQVASWQIREGGVKRVRRSKCEGYVHIQVLWSPRRNQDLLVSC
jgi:hypothetical protein